MTADPYQYFRIEARELLEGLGQGVLDLEREGPSRELIGRLLRSAHTLKGAARVVREPPIAELAHAVEDALTPHREGQGPVPRERIDQVLRILDEIGARIRALGAPRAQGPADQRPGEAPPAEAAARPAAEPAFETVRVQIDEVDTLLRRVVETSAEIGAVRQQLGAVEQARHLASLLCDQLGPRRGAEPGGGGAQAAARALGEELRDGLDRAHRDLATGIDRTERALWQMRDDADRLRLLPGSVLFAPLQRAVRDAAQATRRRVAFVATGDDSRLEAHVLGVLQEALLHVVRNAVAHGIEAAAERAAAGKPEAGQVELRIERRGDRVALLCRDDGRGIDVEAVRRVALARGLVSETEAATMGAAEAARLLLRGGVTTKGTVSEVAGRGIGLDVLREAAARLKGEVTVHTQPGHGTTIELSVPVSFSSFPALLVEAGQIGAAIPLDAVVRTLLVPADQLARSEGASAAPVLPVLIDGGQAVPLLDLARALGAPRAAARRSWPVAVVRAGTGRVAVAVDRLLGTAVVVARRLPPLAPADPIVAGAALDAVGNPQLVLDPGALVAAAGRQECLEPAAAAPARSMVLVIDDSLTTRMLEQSILESAGYEVELATSGEEGLRRARERRHDLFLVDVEMPGMDGFAFLQEARADVTLRGVPAILVTSRGSSEDRRRGEEAGARAHIIKSEFDQGQLWQMIRRLIG